MVSKTHSSVLNNNLVTTIDYGSDADLIRMKPMPSAIESIFKKVGISGSYHAKTDDDVIQNLISWSKSIKVGDQAIEGISLQKYILSN